jgi:hypothetical protein
MDLDQRIAASVRMLHRGIDAKAEEALHFINRSAGQHQRRMREGFEAQRQENSL